MEAISVKAMVKGEEVTFKECGVFDLLKLIKKIRNAVPSGFLGSDSDPLDSFVNSLDDEKVFDTLTEILAAFSDKPKEFFADMRGFSDVESIYTAVRDSEFEKVVRRFFTKLTKGQQTPTE